MRPVQKNDPKPDWRDPDMPVMWPLYDSWTGKAVMMEIQPWEAQALMQDAFRTNDGPNWRNDPTYNLAKRRRRR